MATDTPVDEKLYLKDSATTVMVKLSKTRFWDVFSTLSYFLVFLITMVAVVGLALFVMMQPQLLGLA
ncbi:MAG: hypothetical protein QXI19_09695 [Candidatus Caldarchaeum sp.]